MKTFMERAVSGEIPLTNLSNELMDEVDRWHTTNTSLELYEFLGMSRDEYAAVMFEDIKAVVALIRWKRACAL